MASGTHSIVDTQAPTSSRKASFMEKFLHGFQLWCILHPRNMVSRLLLPPISLTEGLAANSPEYLPSKRQAFGDNFVVAGEVVLGEFKSVEEALISPQARTFRLGTTILDSKHLPSTDKNGRNLFLLALSDKGAGGTGEHEAFRQAANDFVIRSPESMKRSNDTTANALFQQLGKDYAEMSTTGENATFFTDTGRGLSGFFIRYLHYVMYGLDPNDSDKMDILTDLYYNTGVTIYWFRTVGSLIGLAKRGELMWRENLEKVAQIYEESPALQAFKEGNPEYMNLTRRELSQMVLPLMGIAAMFGPKALAESAMGFSRLPAYVGHEGVAEIEVTKWWDRIDLDNRDALKNYLYECGRLWNPVSASHHVATEDFTVKIRGKNRTFKKGTKILIPIILGSLDEAFWGKSTYEFDPNRKNLCPYSMIFHSVGDNSGGRICPGRELALSMLIEVLQVTGKVRRADMPKHSFDYEKIRPLSNKYVKKSVAIDSLLSKDGKFGGANGKLGPRVNGKGPKQVQGVFWLTNQGRSSSLMTFAPNEDGKGLSEGFPLPQDVEKSDFVYNIRVGGDRTWMFADDYEGSTYRMAPEADLIYQFRLTEGTLDDPKGFRIVPQFNMVEFVPFFAMLLGMEGSQVEGLAERAREAEKIIAGSAEGRVRVSAEGGPIDKILKFDAFLMSEEKAAELGYPGSVVWDRVSIFFGKPEGYKLVQIVDGKGNPIQPAYDKWVSYQKSEAAGATPGVNFYTEFEIETK